MAAKTKLLWLADEPAPANLREAIRGRWELAEGQSQEPLEARLALASLAVIRPNGQANDSHALERLLAAVERSSAVALILLDEDDRVAWGVLNRRAGRFLCLRRDAPPAEIAAKLAAAEALQPAIRNLQAELAAARQIGRPASPGQDDLDEEMRLAARLQRDFLPRRLPEVGPVRFGVLYRPLGWVSGDIYDAARLDETHLGFYVADAVGHGMPAALLTMFVKRALQTKRIVGNAYEIIPPHSSLEQLNTAICEQGLSSCQFCTAVYCVLDSQRLTLTYARAGHPAPYLIRPDGRLEELAAPGTLLGVFAEERYESVTMGLSRGDRLVLYTDGIEDALTRRSGDRLQFRRMLASVGRLPREELLLQITAWIDEQPPAARADDDITVMTVDILP